MKQNLVNNCKSNRQCPQCGFSNLAAFYATSAVSVGTQCTELDFPILVRNPYECVTAALSPTTGNYAGIKRKMMDAYESHKKKEIKLSPDPRRSPDYVPYCWLTQDSKIPELPSSSLNTLNTTPITPMLGVNAKRPLNVRLPLLDCGLPTIDYSAISSDGSTAVTQNVNGNSNDKALDLSPVHRTSDTPLLVQAVVIDTKHFSGTPYVFNNNNASMCSPEYGTQNLLVAPRSNNNRGSCTPNSTAVTSTASNHVGSYKVASPSVSQSDVVTTMSSADSTVQPSSDESWEHESPVHEAVYRGNVTCLERECQLRCGDLNTKDSNGETPLHLAVKMQHPEMVRVLVNYGANVATRDRYGNNVLHLIAQSGHLACLEALVSTGSSAIPPKAINALNDEGYAPFHLAVKNKRSEVIVTLINLGALVNLPDGRSGRTALFHAVTLNLPNLALQLMDYGAKTNCADFSGTTPLAAAHGINKQMATLLMSKNTKLRNQQS